MLEKILVPDIGDYENVAVISIAVKVGDKINKEDELITLETDKATMEIPSPHAGVVKELLIKEGDLVSQDSPILMLETEGGSASAENSKKSAQEASNSAKKQTQQEKVINTDVKQNVAEQRSGTDRRSGIERRSGSERRSEQVPYAGPGVRRFARELGVDIANVDGTGRKQRIVEGDVKDYVASTINQPKAVGASTVSRPPQDFAKFGPISTQPLNRIQKISGQFLQNNWASIPHVTQFDEANISQMENFRQEQKELAAKQGLKLTPLVFIMKAVVSCLKTYPKFNASLSDNGDELILKQYFHIGVAVDTPNGLVVPVIRDVDKKSLFELAKELGTVSQKAREGKLTGADMQGGCFTISSLGGIGGSAFTPIINAPEVAILGVSKAQNKPIYNGEKFVPALMLPLSLSYDHRVIDGADAARFTTYLVQVLADIRRILL